MHKDDAPLNRPPANPMPNSGDPHTKPPSQESLVTSHGGIDTSGMPPVDESGLPASRIIGHEEYEVGLGGIFKFFGWFAGLMVMTFVLIYFVLFGFQSYDAKFDVPKSAMATTQPMLPPNPRLQPSRGMEMMEWEYKKRMNDDYDRVMNNYGWVNKEAGTVHIPIDVAMERALKDKKVLPARAATTQSTTKPAAR